MFEGQTSPALKASQKTSFYPPGTRVCVTQQIAHRTHVYPISVTGRVMGQERQASGSWFARNPRHRLWLDRLILEKDDGEKIVLNLDEFTHVTVLEGPPAEEKAAPLITADQDRAGALT